MTTTYRKTDRTVTTPEERTAIAIIAENFGMNYAAKAFRRCQATIIYTCRKAGVKLKRIQRDTPIATRRRCAAIYAKGKHTQRQLAAMFHVTEGRVSQWVQEAKR